MAGVGGSAAAAATAVDTSLDGIHELVLKSQDKQAISREGIEQYVAALNSDAANGLASTAVTHAREQYGANALPPAEVKPIWQLIWDGLHDRTLMMLMAAAILRIITSFFEPCPDPCTGGNHGWIDGAMILFTVLVIVSVTSYNDYSKEAKFRKLNSIKEDRKVEVIRDGNVAQISVFDVVVGDVLRLKTGDMLCADGLFLSGAAVKIDESSSTGEPEAQKKGWGHQVIFLSGTKVVEGQGVMLVIAVGESSKYGRTMMALRGKDDDDDDDDKKEEEKDDGGESGEKEDDAPASRKAKKLTPLQEALGDLAEKIGKIGTAVAGVLFVGLMIKFFIQWSSTLTFSTVLKAALTYFITAITIIVVAVPEGLPLAVTLALAFSMLRMLKDNNLVRELASCEVMGGATTICSDKTGTLTQNKMTVVCGRVGGVNFTKNAAGITELSKDVHAPIRQLLAESIAVNTTATKMITTSATSKSKVVEWVGSSTEIALVNFVTSLKGDMEQLRAANPPAEDCTFPFDPIRKRMSVAIVPVDGSAQRFHTKGAGEIILRGCEYIMNSDGTVQPITDAMALELSSQISQYARNALRVICVATATLGGPMNADGAEPQEISSGLTMLGLLAIQDPLRDEVADAVRECQGAGITVRMVTGDNIDTAKAIAKQCGILTDGIAMEGATFRAMSREAMHAMLPSLQVLARATPIDKLKLVKNLQMIGNVVAVTGDGTNDAPALHKADVGFAMGIAGTEVAKEASSIILMDDNFASIVKAVMWGRNVFDSIRKFLVLQITINIVAVSVAAIGSFSNDSGASPLTAVQLLWVNMVMDTLAALALATESPSRDLLLRRPHGRDANLINNIMKKHIAGQTAFQLIVSLVVLYYAPTYLQIEAHGVLHNTLLFNVFVVMQLFNLLCCRRVNDQKNMFQNLANDTMFLAILALVTVVQFIIVTFGGTLMSTTPLPFQWWLACFGIGFIAIPLSFILRNIKTQEPEFDPIEVSSVAPVAVATVSFDETEADDAPLSQHAAKHGSN